MSSAPAPTRPDPALGVFETLLVRDGQPIELDAHLARLDASVRELFDTSVPPTARALVVERAAGVELARLRLTVAPGSAPDVVVATIDPSIVMPTWDRGADLVSVVVAGGIGAHKWADRSLLAGLEQDLAPRLPLLVDHDHTALEASRANLFVTRGEALVTPPADGRILPGVTRARVLALAAALDIPVSEEPIGLDALGDADGAFLTGAIRGIEPVRGCDGVVVAAEDRITARLARELELSWHGGAVHARSD